MSRLPENQTAVLEESCWKINDRKQVKPISQLLLQHVSVRPSCLFNLMKLQVTCLHVDIAMKLSAQNFSGATAAKHMVALYSKCAARDCS